MGYQRRRPTQKKANAFGLNITSMTDMFTVLLVFLLQNYSTTDMQLLPEKGMNLPLSSTELNPVKSLKISLSPTELKLEDKVIATLEKGEFVARDLDANDTNFIKPLFGELNKFAKESQTEDVKEGRVVMLADSALPYQVLRKVMYTASMAGFPKLKMATVMGE